jgi:hypothetical protein
VEPGDYSQLAVVGSCLAQAVQYGGYFTTQEGLYSLRHLGGAEDYEWVNLRVSIMTGGLSTQRNCVH